MDRASLQARIIELAQAAYETSEPIDVDTDLVALAQRVDPEVLEHLLDALQREFRLAWPEIADAAGKPRTAQLFVEAPLTVTQLADIIEFGAWPQSWVREGKFLRRLFEPWA